MIRGINRQVVEVKETGSEYFEKIMFFVKPEYASVNEGKIRERASLIAGNLENQPPATKMKKDKKTEIINLKNTYDYGNATRKNYYCYRKRICIHSTRCYENYD